MLIFTRKIMAGLLSILLVSIHSVVPAFAAVGTSADIKIAPPTNVVAITNRAGGMAVTWSPSPHEASGSVNNYKVQYKLSTDTVWLDVVDGLNNGIVYPPSPNEYSITNLIVGENYDARVIAVSKYNDTLNNTIMSRLNDANAEDVGVNIIMATAQKIVAAPTSIISMSAGATITNWRAAAGNATLAGIAASNSTELLFSVKLSIQNIDTNTYWNGSAWQSGSILLDAAMADGAMNSPNENWEYLSLSEQNMSTGNYIVSVTSTSQSVNQAAPTTVNFRYETPLTSSFVIADTSDVLSFSNTAGSATLHGAATTASGTISAVQITMQRSSDSLYWHGTDWQASAVWLDAHAIDGAFDTATEAWEYVGMSGIHMTAGNTYTLTPRAGKAGPIFETNPIGHVFSYQKTLPNIGMITAGPSATNRTGIANGVWINKQATGDDALISFAWESPVTTGSTTFYHVIDTNNQATSIASTASNAAATSNPYLDMLAGSELSEGASYLHVQAQNNSDGIWGLEQVFEIKYDATAPTVLAASTTTPSGKYAPGTQVDVTITFSEPVTAAADLIVHFDSGGSMRIPAFATPRTSMTQIYTIGTFENTNRLYIQLIEGALTDHANNIAINTVPVDNMHSSAAIIVAGVRIDIIDPLPVHQQYTTIKNTIAFRANTPSAVRMRIPSSSGFDMQHAQNSIAFDTWVPYTENDIVIALSPDLGARMLTVEFENAAHEKRTAYAVITRLGTELALIDQVAKQEELVVAQETIALTNVAAYLPAGTDLTQANPALFDDLNQAIATSDLKKIQHAVERLLDILNKIEILRTLLVMENAKELMAQIIPLLDTYQLDISLILTTNEISKLLSILTTEQTNIIMPYIDPSVITVRVDEETLQPIVEEQPVSIRDTDGDGLSDLLELEYGTNPYTADTDGDGYSDGMEVLDLGTDPTVFDKDVATHFTNITSGMTVNDPTPVLRGTAPVDANLMIIAIARNGSEIDLGTATADTENKWIHISNVALSDGIYELRLIDDNGIVQDTQTISVNLDFVLPAPELVATNEGDINVNGELVFAGDQPVFYGNTYYGSTIVASFQSLLTSTSVIADNPEGDFEIRPPRKLEAGSHTLTLYAELPDGTRSAAKVLRFSVNPGQAASIARQAIIGDVFSLKNMILLLLLVNFSVLAFEAWRESGKGTMRRRRIAT